MPSCLVTPGAGGAGLAPSKDLQLNGLTTFGLDRLGLLPAELALPPRIADHTWQQRGLYPEDPSTEQE